MVTPQNSGAYITARFRCLVISMSSHCLLQPSPTLTIAVGCNSRNNVFQLQIGRSISALRKDREDRQFWSSNLGFVPRPRIVRFSANKTSCRYIKAQNWPELASAAYESLSDCPVDKMVRTVRSTQGRDAPDPSHGLMVLTFTSESTLFSQYQSSPLVIDVRRSMLRPTAKTFVPQALSTTVTRAPSPASNEQALMNRGTVEPAATISAEGLQATATSEEINAAIVIQVAYRQVLRRRAAIVIQLAYRRALRRRASPLPKDGRVKWWYDQCVDAQIHLQGPKSYSKYFLGPLVHALIWADALVRLLRNRKDRAKKKFRPADHRQIEDLMERLAVCQ